MSSKPPLALRDNGKKAQTGMPQTRKTVLTTQLPWLNTGQGVGGETPSGRGTGSATNVTGCPGLASVIFKPKWGPEVAKLQNHSAGDLFDRRQKIRHDLERAYCRQAKLHGDKPVLWPDLSDYAAIMELRQHVERYAKRAHQEARVDIAYDSHKDEFHFIAWKTYSTQQVVYAIPLELIQNMEGINVKMAELIKEFYGLMSVVLHPSDWHDGTFGYSVDLSLEYAEEEASEWDEDEAKAWLEAYMPYQDKTAQSYLEEIRNAKPSRQFVYNLTRAVIPEELEMLRVSMIEGYRLLNHPKATAWMTLECDIIEECEDGYVGLQDQLVFCWKAEDTIMDHFMQMLDNESMELPSLSPTWWHYVGPKSSKIEYNEWPMKMIDWLDRFSNGIIQAEKWIQTKS
ncbi:MAG: hypothetical protein JNM00_06875 [Flavobacteriales bacterium]|nr:hypothetical protein [Flavobacteriales bacterium]